MQAVRIPIAYVTVKVCDHGHLQIPENVAYHTLRNAFHPDGKVYPYCRLCKELWRKGLLESNGGFKFKLHDEVICALVARGYTNEEIAKELNLSVSAIHTILADITLRLGLRHRRELTIWIGRHFDSLGNRREAD